MNRTTANLKPGFTTGAIAVDLVTSPVMRVCDAMKEAFADDDGIGTTITMSLELQSPTDVVVRMLRSNQNGSGAAGDAMTTLMRLCDRHGVTARLQAVSLADPGDDCLDQNALEAFYARRGFVQDDANWRAYAMIRRPSSVDSKRMALAA